MDFYDSLLKITGEKNLLRDEPMRNHTTFRIGGPADYFVCPDHTEELLEILRVCREADMPWFILGNGSNLLVGDKGYRGVVIQINKNFARMTEEKGRLTAGAGVMMSKLAKFAQERGLTGIEFASGIPGTLGGACVMNAGAYGGEMSQVLTSVTVVDQAGNLIKLPVRDLEMGYRTSLVKKKGLIVVEAKMQLEKGDSKAIAECMGELRKTRCSKQPLESPSAGSTFKRPEGYFAGKLIMDAGLRGYAVGGARVSEKHCGFVISDGTATAADVRALMNHVTDVVRSKFGVILEPEVQFLGEGF